MIINHLLIYFSVLRTNDLIKIEIIRIDKSKIYLYTVNYSCHIYIYIYLVFNGYMFTTHIDYIPHGVLIPVYNIS